MRPSSTATRRIASLTIGTSSGSRASVLAPHLQHLAGGQLEQAANRAEHDARRPPPRSPRARAPTTRPPRVRGPALRATVSGFPRSASAAARSSMPSRRTIGRCSSPARRTIAARRRDRHARPHGQQPRPGARSRRSCRRGRVRAQRDRLQLWRWIADPRHRFQPAAACQSTMSSSTCCPSPVAAAFTTVRSACAVRPPRPITLP